MTWFKNFLHKITQNNNNNNNNNKKKEKTNIFV
jgi:hypothetical protein